MIIRLAIAVLVCAAWAEGASDGLAAFSLKEAERSLRANGPNRVQAEQLGGLTRLLGLVYDRDDHDIILVGQREAGARSLDLPSLVIAMRAVLVRREWPLVSIDPGPDTARTRKQVVRLEGGLAGSQFGEDFLLADVRLKRLGLGLDSAPGLEHLSYFDLRAKVIAARPTRTEGSSRFWFYAVDPGLEQRDDVFLIRHLQLGVRAQTVTTAQSVQVALAKDEAAEAFARKLSGSFSKLCETFPDLARLQSLYEMVAAARGMEDASEDSTRYWFSEYTVPAVPTPSEFDIVGRQELIQTAIGKRYFEVSGGIQFAALTVRLLDGDITALKEAVLLARPRDGALSWDIPIDEQWLQEDSRIPLTGFSKAPDPDAGTNLTWQTGAPSQESTQRKANLKDAVAKIDEYLKRAQPISLTELPETKTSGMYHSNDGGQTNFQPKSTLEAAANSKGRYYSDDGGNTFKQSDTPSAGSGTGGAFLCITASCVGPRQSSSDGLKAEPYATGDLSPYSLHRYFDAGYAVSLNGKTVGSGWGDVKLLGGGRFAAKDWNGPGYQIRDENGKQVSNHVFSQVESIGNTGYFAVPGDGGWGMTTVYSPDLKPVRTVPVFDLNGYLQGPEFGKELLKNAAAQYAGPPDQPKLNTQPIPIEPLPNTPAGAMTPGGIKIDIGIREEDIQRVTRRPK